MIIKKIYYICNTIKYQIETMKPLENIAILSWVDSSNNKINESNGFSLGIIFDSTR